MKANVKVRDGIEVGYDGDGVLTLWFDRSRHLIYLSPDDAKSLVDALVSFVGRPNWKAMSPRDVWEALQSPPKIAGPWEEGDAATGGCAVRRAPSGVIVVVDGFWAMPDYPSQPWRVPVGDRADADEILRKNGWLLV